MIIDSIVGNVKDEIWEKKLSNALIDYVTLNQWEAQKNRFKRLSDQGVEVAVSLDRGDYLHDGDILVWDEDNDLAIVVHIHLKKVMVIYLDELLNEDPEKMLQTAIELGHALGNQHWPAVYKDKKIFIPMTLDEKAMSSVMRTHNFTGHSL